MRRPRIGSLLLAAALLCAGCVVVGPTPSPPTAALITATAPTPTAGPPSATAISIVTATASPSAAVGLTAAPDTATANLPTAALDTPLPVTAPPDLPSSTPIPSETSTSAPGVTPAPTTVPSATPPAGATAQPVGITSFTISPQTITPGQFVTLTWQATGEQATIYRLEPGGPLTDMHSVPLAGALVLQTPATQRDRVDYVLYAGAGGSTASATVSAVILCPDKWFFAPAPAGCPGGPGTLIPMAAERFQHGLMIWVSGQDWIYTLFGDGANGDGASPAWSADANGWFQGQPETDPGLTPPAGLYQPVRGFGLLWRAPGSVPGVSRRDRLGWALEPEAALTGGYQCDSAPKYNHCYLSGPGGQVYHLLPEFSGWQVWTGP